MLIFRISNLKHLEINKEKSQIDGMLLNQDHATLQDLHLNKTISVAHADERNGKYSISFKGCMSIIKAQAHHKSQTSNGQIILEMPKPQIISLIYS